MYMLYMYMCMYLYMCARAGRVHAPVRTPGGCTGVREPGTPAWVPVYLSRGPSAVKRMFLCHGFVSFPLPAHPPPSVTYAVCLCVARAQPTGADP